MRDIIMRCRYCGGTVQWKRNFQDTECSKCNAINCQLIEIDDDELETLDD